MRIVITGKGGSGKDYLKQKFIDKGYKPSISTTTRPARDGEKEGVDYFFDSPAGFVHLEKAGGFQETDIFNGWHYGTKLSQWENSEIFIKTPRGVSRISPEDRKNCFIIYLDIDEGIRFQRLMKRQDADSVQRRIKADQEDFKLFTDYDLRITNYDF